MGHSSYLWSTGAATRRIQITAADTYYVYVPYGQGGYISSERIIITNLSNPCSQVGTGGTSQNLPQEYYLEQNYPNPFNPETKIKFAIPYTSGSLRTTLKIYDAIGREIETLLDEELTPGTHQLDWNASAYPSGVYFYTLSSGSFSQTRKMLMIK